MDHRDVVLQAVTLRYSEEAFMKVGTLEVWWNFQGFPSNSRRFSGQCCQKPHTFR